MFKFFRLKQKQAVTAFSGEISGIYDLNDQEVERLIGGSPIRHLLVSPSSRGRQRTTPRQQLNRFHSAAFQEAFTLQQPQQEARWSWQEVQRRPSRWLSNESD
jgi:hypothetical protein